MTAYKKYFFFLIFLNVSENHPASYKAKGQLWVTGQKSYITARALKLNSKHLHKYKQSDDTPTTATLI